ncbi:nicotinamide mononucleotide transporter [Lewinella marina]|uniref:Nicotinamide riboside transporter PnuC n=1 Tax=Neolewinella marina TaxID=438751 RepID=A0A2G0CD95_9BACT|nr:nicotinamide riboside transporter PnuC [Neolewinella marina]NJB86856.1 nicotinamide mononucleotide transporter [Neolewinella marina]PHK97944.1 nicotinamide mononucleotide transporter [Neolewinella marina]
MEELLAQVYATDTVEWIATAAALAYVYLAARDSNWCWFFAALSAALWGYQSFVVYQLVSDALLQAFYLVMAGVGLFRWQRTRGTRPENEMLDGLAVEPAPPETDIQRMSILEHALTLGGGLATGLLLGYTVGSLTTATQTYLDAVTTTFSVIATFLLIGRRLENWIYFIVIDAAYVYIYLRSGALLFALLMVLYVIMAVYGYLAWRSTVDRSYDTAR